MRMFFILLVSDFDFASSFRMVFRRWAAGGIASLQIIARARLSLPRVAASQRFHTHPLLPAAAITVGSSTAYPCPRGSLRNRLPIEKMNETLRPAKFTHFEWPPIPGRAP